MRESLRMLLQSVSIKVISYASADEFLREYKDTPSRQAVLVLDVRMPGMSGMALLERLRAERPSLPVIMITGHGDIDMAVNAMKLGAVDFITKPFSSQVLLDRIQEVLRRSQRGPARGISAKEATASLSTLTIREREIFQHIVSGESNRAIASHLKISIRTVESHRASIMEKTGAKGLVDLVLLWVSLDRPA
jgi:FixJ family two-component response regulator